MTQVPYKLIFQHKRLMFFKWVHLEGFSFYWVNNATLSVFSVLVFWTHKYTYHNLTKLFLKEKKGKEKIFF